MSDVAPIPFENKSDLLSPLTKENSTPRNNEAVFEDSPTSIQSEDITPHEEALAPENTPIKSPLKVMTYQYLDVPAAYANHQIDLHIIYYWEGRMT